MLEVQGQASKLGGAQDVACRPLRREEEPTSLESAAVPCTC